MSARLYQILLFWTAAVLAGTTAIAGEPGPNKCVAAWPEAFAAGQPFRLNDPRSGLMLHIESDGRHMAAATRDGKVLWHRDVFADPKIERMIPPPPTIEDDHGFSWRPGKNWVHNYVARLEIDRIAVEPDCMVRLIDHDLPPQFHGHYIRAGSGTHIFWLLDANTGDLEMEQIN